MELSLNARRIARRHAGAHSNCWVAVVDGSRAPEMTGESWHYETMGGTRIYYPSAYSRRGWSNMRYIGSTLCVVVGRKWLERRGLIDAPVCQVELAVA